MEYAGTSQTARSAAARGGHLQVVADAVEDARRADSWIPVALAVGVGAVALVALISSSLPAERALAGASPAARAAVVERALGNLRDACRSADRPREFCVEQARLVVEQPECDAACQALARDELAADTAVR